jgi:hypothetical protein
MFSILSRHDKSKLEGQNWKPGKLSRKMVVELKHLIIIIGSSAILSLRLRGANQISA